MICIQQHSDLHSSCSDRLDGSRVPLNRRLLLHHGCSGRLLLWLIALHKTQQQKFTPNCAADSRETFRNVTEFPYIQVFLTFMFQNVPKVKESHIFLISSYLAPWLLGRLLLLLFLLFSFSCSVSSGLSFVFLILIIILTKET